MAKKNTLSKMLNLKENKKKEIEIEVKKAADRADDEGYKLDNLEKDYTETLEFFHEKNDGGTIDIDRVTAYYDYFSRINSKINEQKKVHDRYQDELESLKKNLVEAHRDKRAFEILKEKEIKRNEKEKMSAEQKESDFFTLSRRLK